MKLKLNRVSSDVDGVFGILTDEKHNKIAVTLEHAFDAGHGNGSYTAKVAPGTYVCKRHPPARLPYETFMLEHVPKFNGKDVTGILFHIGNYNSDSDGCILVGRNIIPTLTDSSTSGDQMITSSKNTFLKLMDILKGLDSFTLEIQ